MTVSRTEVTGIVLFDVTVKLFPSGDGHWVCVGKQTGIVSHGKDENEAIARNARLHQAVVRRLKRNGAAALASFMDSRAIEFDVQDGGTPIRTVDDFHVKSTTGASRELQTAA